MICANNHRTPASSGFLLKIRHGCRTETLTDGRITVSAGFDYRLTVDVAVITLEHLLLEFGKFPISQNEEFVIRYYDNNSDNFCDVTTDDALTLMWGKQPGSRTVLMSIHIVYKFRSILLTKRLGKRLSSMITSQNLRRQLNGP